MFTSIADDTYGGDSNNDGATSVPQSSSSGYMLVHDGSMSHALFRYGDGLGNGMLRITGNLSVDQSSFSLGEIGIACNGSSTPSIQNCTFDQQEEVGVSLSLGSTPTFTNNTFTNNALAAIGLLSETYDNDTFHIRTPQTFGLPSLPYVINPFQEIRIRSGARLEIEPGVIIKGSNTISNIRIDGEAIIEGTEQSPIVFTSLKDDSQGGDTNLDGATTQAQAGDWGGIRINSHTSSANISHCLIQYGGGSSNGALLLNRTANLEKIEFLNNDLGIKNIGGQTSLDSCNLRDNDVALQNDGGSPTVHNSDFVGNITFAINNNTTTNLDATNNWWGDLSGPENATNNPSGQGDKVSDFVLFNPYLNASINDTMMLVNNDLGVSGLVEPISGCELSAQENVKIRVVNTGLNLQNAFSVGILVNGIAGPSINLSSQNLAAGQNVEIDLPGTIDLSNFGLYEIKAYVNLPGDQAAFNDTMLVSINNLPPIQASINGPSSYCEGTIALLQAQGGANYEWNTGSTANIISVSPTLLTQYFVIASNNLGCRDTAYFTLTPLPNPDTPQVSLIGMDSICLGDTVSLISSITDSITWSTGSTNALIQVSQSGTYFVTRTGINGCSSASEPTSIVVRPAPFIQVAGVPAICLGDSIVLTVQSSDTQIWSNGASTPSITVSPSDTTVYFVDASFEGCQVRDSVVVAVVDAVLLPFQPC